MSGFNGFAEIVKLMGQKAHEDEIITDINERLALLKEYQGKIQAASSFIKELKSNITAQSKATSSSIKALESELKSAVGMELFTQLIAVAETGAVNTKPTKIINKAQDNVLYLDVMTAIESVPAKVEASIEEVVETPVTETVVEEVVEAPVTETVVEEVVETPVTETVVEEVVETPVTETVVEEVVETPVTETVAEEVVETPVTETVVEEVVETPVTETVAEEVVEAPVAEPSDSLAPPRVPRFRRVPKVL